MVRAVRSFLQRKLHVLGLFQIALVGTAFAAFRLLQSPSTLTFFVFESALAVTLGIFLSGRLAPKDYPSSSLRHNASAPEIDANSSSRLARLQNLAVRLDLPPIGEIEDLQDRIKSDLSKRHANSAEDETNEEALAELLVHRIAPGAYLSRVSPPPSPTTSYLGSLAEEGRALLWLSQDLQLRSTFYKRMLRKAREASSGGFVDAAVRILENGNKRLRTRLRGQITSDLKEFHRRSRRAYLGLSSLFVFLTAVALWALSLGLYVAPLAFFVLVAMAVGALSLNAQLSGNHRPTGLLLQIMTLAVLLKFHFFYLNPYLYTSDTFFHFRGIEAIGITGYVPEFLAHYFYFPGSHVFGFAGVSVAGLPLTWFGIFTFVAQLAAIPIAYLIGREIASPRVGLFSAILAVFSIFFFLPTIPLPSLFGFVFLFTAIYALVKMRGPDSRAWFALFWISALGAFFSHAISALVLLLALILRFVHLSVLSRRAAEARTAATPVLSYGVVYAGYLAFIALVSFEVFVRSVFAPTQESPLATAPAQELQIAASYLLQSAIAPSGIAILLFFAAFGMFSAHGISASERRFLMLLGLAFLLIPAVEVVVESFRAQSSRFLGYMTIPLVLLGGHGVVSVNRLFRSGRRLGTILVPLFVVFAFVSSSSYLTTNDERSLYFAIPALSTHITESALSSRQFMNLADLESVVYMDLGSFRYFGNDDRAPNSLGTLSTIRLDEFQTGTRHAYVLLNYHFLAYGDPHRGLMYDTMGLMAMLNDAHAARVFDTGDIQVYSLP